MPTLIARQQISARGPDLAALLLRDMPAGQELVSYQIDDWHSAGTCAQLHLVKVQVAAGRLDDLKHRVRALEGQCIGAWCILETGLDDLGGGVADVHMLVTD